MARWELELPVPRVPSRFTVATRTESFYLSIDTAKIMPAVSPTDYNLVKYESDEPRMLQHLDHLVPERSDETAEPGPILLTVDLRYSRRALGVVSRLMEHGTDVSGAGPCLGLGPCFGCVRAPCRNLGSAAAPCRGP